MNIHSKLAAFLARQGATITRSGRHKFYCTRRDADGTTSSFRVEILKKSSSTKTGVTGSIDMGVDAGAWKRICRGSSVLAVEIADVDGIAIAIPPS